MSQQTEDASALPALALDQTVDAHMHALGDRIDTIQLSPRSTIMPEQAGTDTFAERALTLLTHNTADGSLALEGTIGEGGMGIVRLGVQRSLGRHVAVKTLRDGHRNRNAVMKLLREAWITGALEHPNILPIHDLRLDDGGMPLVVLKRIEGSDWSTVMKDAALVRERFGATDLLEHNLGVLMQVCRAIAFAHSHHIIHRDIKPENIRIGAFGEVYVLDWGIAVTIGDDPSDRFPRPTGELAGTPAYMAPEMLGGDSGAAVGIHSDIYLLGATLYELVVGKAPHAGTTPREVIASVLLSRPELPRSVPDELATIIRRCMHTDPRSRYQSADEVRVAIGDFIDHRGSMRLAQKARERFRELAAHLQIGAINQGQQNDAAKTDDAGHRVRAYDLFGECRSGFRGAIDLWSANPDARDGLRELMLVMIGYELSRGDARTAQTMRQHVVDVPADLDEQIGAGLRAQDKELRRLERLQELARDMDPRIGQRSRAFVSAVLAGTWTVLPLLTGVLFRVDLDASHMPTLVMNASAFSLFAGLFYWARESLLKTQLNRNLAFVMLAMLASHFVLLAGGLLMGLDAARVQAFHFLVWFLVALVSTITIDRRLWPITIAELVGWLIVARYLHTRHVMMSVMNFVAVVNMVVIWWPRESKQPPSTIG